MSQAMQRQGVKSNAKTVAQFLIQSGRFNYNTMRYQLSETEAKDVPFTVIIDECSMLTEEMFGALLQALRKAQRIIFVGDPNQLPPIGAGRPFVDLVRYLKKDIPQFPRVGKSYGELTVTAGRRMKTAKSAHRHGSCRVVCGHLRPNLTVNICAACRAIIVARTFIQNVVYHRRTGSSLFSKPYRRSGMKDWMISTVSISVMGGTVGASNNFNLGCADKSESWQVLAPVRGLVSRRCQYNPYHPKIKSPELHRTGQSTGFWQRKIPRLWSRGIV